MQLITSTFPVLCGSTIASVNCEPPQSVNMFVAGRLATTKLAFMVCHTDQPNTAVVTQIGSLLGSCQMADC